MLLVRVTLALMFLVFVALIITNCIVLGRADTFAMNNNVKDSFIDGFANSLGYGIILILVAFFRELLGSGSIYGFSVFGKNHTYLLNEKNNIDYFSLNNFLKKNGENYLSWTWKAGDFEPAINTNGTLTSFVSANEISFKTDKIIYLEAIISILFYTL